MFVWFCCLISDISLCVFAAQHKAIARKNPQQKSVPGVLGLEGEKVKAIQTRIDDFTKNMSNLLLIERDAELEFTQEELNAVPTPDENSDSPKPIEFLVSHSQAEQELCDTIFNLNAVSTSTGYITFLLMEDPDSIIGRSGFTYVFLYSVFKQDLAVCIWYCSNWKETIDCPLLPCLLETWSVYGHVIVEAQVQLPVCKDS